MGKDKRYQSAQVGALAGIFVNLFLAGIKFVAGILGHSSALQADAFHSLSDVFTSVAVLVGIWIGARPADAGHPYGHGKAESISAWIVAALLVGMALAITYEAIIAIIFGARTPPPTFLAFWVALLSAAVNELLYQYKVRLGNRLGSTSLIADAWHHRSDAISSLVVVVGITAAIIGGGKWYIMDQASAIIVAFIIGATGIRLLKKTTDELMDAALSEEFVEKIRLCAMQNEQVHSTNVINARKSGLDILADIEIQVNKDLTVNAGHDIAHQVKDKIMADLPNIKYVVVHVEPYTDSV